MTRPWLLLFLIVGTAAAAAASNPIVEVPTTTRSAFARIREDVNVTVGKTVSLVAAQLEYLYVRDYDAADHLNPFIVDVPVIVRSDDTDPGRILKLANARFEIGHAIYRPQTVLLLAHDAFAPVPDIPDGTRIALVSFNIPRRGLKPHFLARLAYDQPHVPGPSGGELSVYVPLLPDLEQLRAAVPIKPDDFTVTFTALPDVRLQRETINAEVVEESPEKVVIRPRHREAITVLARPVAEE